MIVLRDRRTEFQQRPQFQQKHLFEGSEDANFGKFRNNASAFYSIFLILKCSDKNTAVFAFGTVVYLMIGMNFAGI